MRAKDGCAQRYGSHSLRLPRALNVDAPLVKVADASGKHKLEPSSFVGIRAAGLGGVHVRRRPRASKLA